MHASMMATGENPFADEDEEKKDEEKKDEEKKDEEDEGDEG